MVTRSLAKRAKLQWLNAYHRRTGNVCIRLTDELAYELDRHGYGVRFIEVRSGLNKDV